MNQKTASAPAAENKMGTMPINDLSARLPNSRPLQQKTKWEPCRLADSCSTCPYR